MPKDENFNLDNPDGVSDDDIQRMIKEEKELKRIAESAEGSAEKIKEAKKSIEGLSFAQLNILDKSLEGGEGAAGLGAQQLLDFKAEILKEIQETKKEVKKNSKKISEEEKARKEALKKVKDQQGDVNEVHGMINGMRSNPFNFGKNKALNMIGKAGIYGVLAQFAIEQGQQVYEEVLAEVKSQFEAGGVWDRRKLVEDVLNEYNSIEYLTRVKSGGVFFTADAGQDLRQGAARGANNTRDLRDGHVRFLQFHFNE